MVILNKSNWFKGLLLLPILVTMGFLNNPIASSKTEPLPKIQQANIQLETVVPQVAEVKQQTLVAAQVTSKEQEFVTQTGYALKIGSINLNISLSKTTLGKNKELLVPANPNVAAWYRNGPVPGAAGTALITGHLDSPAGPGVFINLKKVQVNDLIEVRRDDGKVAIFVVDTLESYAQDHTFPWSEVYSTTGNSGLRIITCDGVYNPKTQRYSRNLVVYASLVSLN
jgi:sortase (surface protein transpeptidase)